MESSDLREFIEECELALPELVSAIELMKKHHSLNEWRSVNPLETEGELKVVITLQEKTLKVRRSIERALKNPLPDADIQTLEKLLDGIGVVLDEASQIVVKIRKSKPI
jgi:hypothetical protein